MKISEITKHKIPKYLYKWVNGKQFQKYLDNKKLPVKRNYAHFIDEKNDFIKGNSFTDKNNIDKWNGDTLIKIDTTKIQNNIYPIPGNRTYLKTMGMINKNYDPKSYQYESEDIDEYWIEGTLDLSSAKVIKSLTENQKFDFDKYKPQILNYIQRIKSNKENDFQDETLFYNIITNKPTVGAAKSITINPQVWKNYFSNKPFNSNGVWSQRDFNTQLKDNQNNINFYITIEKSNDNVIKFIQTLRFLDKELEELSNKTQSRISYKTHTILDSFMGHNDSLKIYYNNPQLKNQIQTITKKWATDNNVTLSQRTHEHGLDTDKSFGERLAKSVNDTIKDTIKKYKSYTDEQLFEWIKKYLPEMIKSAKDSKS